MNSIKNTESDPCALAEVCWLSELEGASFLCWIQKSIPALCGSGLINDNWMIVVPENHACL